MLDGKALPSEVSYPAGQMHEAETLQYPPYSALAGVAYVR